MSDQITIQDPCMHPNVQFRKMLMHLFKFPCIKISSVVVRKTKLEIRATWAHLFLTLILPSFLRSEIILKSSKSVFRGSSEIQRDLCVRDQRTKTVWTRFGPGARIWPDQDIFFFKSRTSSDKDREIFGNAGLTGTRTEKIGSTRTGYIDVGDRCWRRNLLVTTLR